MASSGNAPPPPSSATLCRAWYTALTAAPARADPFLYVTNGPAHTLSQYDIGAGGLLAPLSPPGLFAVIDRIGPGQNLEEQRLDPPCLIEAP